MFRPLSTKTVGFLGVGDVGREVAGVFKQLGMTCVGFSLSTTNMEVKFDIILDIGVKISDCMNCYLTESSMLI